MEGIPPGIHFRSPQFYTRMSQFTNEMIARAWSLTFLVNVLEGGQVEPVLGHKTNFINRHRAVRTPRVAEPLHRIVQLKDNIGRFDDGAVLKLYRMGCMGIFE